jgi:ABC-type sugar transport system ATPase subunit
MEDYLVRMAGICKSYPGVCALDGVDFDLRPGEVHCLVGENGAGKSTLMKILSGAEQADAGQIAVAGNTWSGYSPVQAHALGIAAIYQETDLVPDLTVAQNIFLGHEPVNRWKGLDRRALRRQSAELLDLIHLDVAPDDLVADLTPANRQLVQILKALSYESRILIMDEPGAVLSDYELDRLFNLLSDFKREGMGIIYISHRLEEILRIGDRVTILRDGTHIATADAHATTTGWIIEQMVGRPLGEQYTKTPALTEAVAMSVRHLSRKGQFEDISFDLRRGEILGLAGLVGAGRSDLLRCLFGLERATSGEIEVDGKVVAIHSPQAAMAQGLGLIPEDRRESGLIVNRSVRENICMTVIDRMGRGAVVSSQRVNRLAHHYIDKLAIRTPSILQLVRNLSGGNQQKIVLSKWLAAETRILLLDEPTRGVDVNAKAEIYRAMNELAAQGVSIIMASSELPEVLGMSDRVIVMAAGRVTTVMPIEEATQVEIMRHAVPTKSTPNGKPQTLFGTSVTAVGGNE